MPCLFCCMLACRTILTIISILAMILLLSSIPRDGFPRLTALQASMPASSTQLTRYSGPPTSSQPEQPAPASSSSSNTKSNDSTLLQQYELVVPEPPADSSSDVLLDVARRVRQLENEGKGRKIISMSLYGNDTRYTYGAIENALMVKRGWPGWTLRIYYGEGLPEDILETVRLLGAETISVPFFQSKASSTIWRFFVLADRTVSRFIVRDIDARLTPRDYRAVLEWMSTKHPFHILRDDYFHGVAIMGGMWGAVNGLLHPRVLNPYQRMTNQTDSEAMFKWAVDQSWLANVVFPLVKNHTLVHASWHCKKYGEAEWRGFPTQRVSNRDFIGNVYW